MSDAKRVQIVDRCSQLVCNVSGKVLRDDKLTFVEEREEVTAIEDLHHDVYRVLILEDVEELYYVWMLANFEHLNLSFQ